MSFFQKSLFLPKVQKIMTKKNYQFSLIVFILFSRIVYSPEELLPPIANSPEELLPPISVGVVNEVTTSIKANSPNVVANFFII